VRLMAAMLDNTAVNADVCRSAASDPSLLATDLADYLVRKKMPFRQAHHVVGAAVAFAEKNSKPLDKVTVEEFKALDKAFDEDVVEVFDLAKAMARRQVIGAPGTKEVRKQIARWNKALVDPKREV
jgi:argininosuccinate lyase